MCRAVVAEAYRTAGAGAHPPDMRIPPVPAEGWAVLWAQRRPAAAWAQAAAQAALARPAEVRARAEVRRQTAVRALAEALVAQARPAEVRAQAQVEAQWAEERPAGSAEVRAAAAREQRVELQSAAEPVEVRAAHSRDRTLVEVRALHLQRAAPDPVKKKCLYLGRSSYVPFCSPLAKRSPETLE